MNGDVAPVMVPPSRDRRLTHAFDNHYGLNGREMTFPKTDCDGVRINGTATGQPVFAET
jgi:hypothetical protein